MYVDVGVRAECEVGGGKWESMKGQGCRGDVLKAMKGCRCVNGRGWGRSMQITPHTAILRLPIFFFKPFFPPFFSFFNTWFSLSLFYFLYSLSMFPCISWSQALT